MIDPPLTTRFDERWPQGMVGRRETRIVKNARLYLAATDGQITKVGWGDLCLEQWHILREITQDGIGLVAYERFHGTLTTQYDRSEAADATFEDLIPALALALDSEAAILLNHSDPDRHTLGAVSLPALNPRESRSWVADRLADLVGSA